MSATAWKKEKEARSGGMSSSGAVQNTLPSILLLAAPVAAGTSRKARIWLGALNRCHRRVSQPFVLDFLLFFIAPLSKREPHTHT